MDLTIAVATTDPEAVGRALRIASLAGDVVPEVEVVLLGDAAGGGGRLPDSERRGTGSYRGRGDPVDGLAAGHEE